MSSMIEPRRLYGCLVSAYTCEWCNAPSVAAIANQGELIPVCEEHARQAEAKGQTVLRQMPTKTK